MNRFAFSSNRTPLRRPAARGRFANAAGLAALALLVFLRLPAAAEDPHSIVVSKHNLSVSGPGDVRAVAETEICVFCHSPHSSTGQTPLWNHELSATAYTPYRSSTMKATVGQPTGASKLCLSCHDGTVALGMVRNQSTPIQMRSSSMAMPAGRSRTGSDLSGHHPISFTYDSALAGAKGTLRDPNTLRQQVRVDKNKQVQCTSCHDPHNSQYGMFLVKDNTGSALCLDCHAPAGWAGSAHAMSKATWNGSGVNPWPHSRGTTVAANGCENCHTSHAAGTKTHLLTQARAEDTCLVCHRGTVAGKSLANDFNKPSGHPVTSTASLHDAAEGSLAPAGRHVSCVDCHDVHATRATELGSSGAGTTLSAAQTRVKGVNATGAVVTSASRQCEVCFRCHGDNTSYSGNARLARQYSQPNTRLQFSPGNASYHPIVSATKSGQSRSLLSTWTGGRQMQCTDCHNNDQGPGAGGSGANGPHGSRYAPLLERNLVQTDFQPESTQAYALCYKCHSQGVLLSDRLHSKHVRDEKTACTTCHDSHGVQTQPHLINFNTVYVKPSSGRIAYTDLGGSRSSCTLTCHGSTHNNRAY